MSSRRILAAALLLGVSAVALSGCAYDAEPEPSTQELRSLTQSLVPTGARIVAQEDGECIQVAPQPSCVTVFFVLPGRSLAQRVDAVSSHAEAGGWSERDRSDGPGGATLYYRRPGLTASVALILRPKVSCAGRSPSDCGGRMDHASVLRLGE
jgi:hypothetical protein